jgi:hypothetical protein
MTMKKTLFYTFVFVFGATATVTLLGLTPFLEVKEPYLERLFMLLVAEAVAPVIALFRKTDFFGDEGSGTSKINVVLLPKDSFIKNQDPHQCTVKIYNQETDEETEVLTSAKRVNGYLSFYLSSVLEQEMIKVHIINSSNESWESEYFSPSVAKAEMEKS